MAEMATTPRPKRTRRKKAEAPTEPVAPRPTTCWVTGYDLWSGRQLLRVPFSDWDEALGFVPKIREYEVEGSHMQIRVHSRVTGEIEVFNPPIPTPTLDDQGAPAPAEPLPESATTSA